MAATKNQMIMLIRVFIGIILCTGCKKKNAELVFIQSRVLQNVPSGSGLAVANNKIYLIGDDATAIYCINQDLQQSQKISIEGLDTSILRESKSIKHDFESAAILSINNRFFLAAFGSGSKIHMRDSLLLMNISDESQSTIYSLEKIYGQIRNQHKIDFKDWNIEGAAVMKNQIVLANRGTNSLFIFSQDSFVQVINDSLKALNSIEIKIPDLPAIEGKQSRLSGLCAIDDKTILFSASVEDTPDWTVDGPVLGSYIGIYYLKEKKITKVCLLKDAHGTILKDKIESVEILQNKNDRLEIIAVADNDDGSSTLFRLDLPHNK